MTRRRRRTFFIGVESVDRLGTGPAAIAERSYVATRVVRLIQPKSLVFRVDVPDGFLHQALHHRVETHAALLRLREAEGRLRDRADLHLLFGVAGRDLLGRLRVDDLVAHADDPHARRFAGLHRAQRRAANGAGTCTADG